jgi:hypothetical protein
LMQAAVRAHIGMAQLEVNHHGACRSARLSDR